MPDQYYSNINHDVLRCIPPNAKVVLETGCGAGALGRAYKQINPFCHYIGMEVFPEAARVARQYLDKVICGDAEELSLASMLLPDEKVDCLVYGDVLEHLHDPWHLLKEHTSHLSEEGQVIACIPNVQHWSVLAGLLKGQWRYADNGLLDRTHLRFFTLESVHELFEQAGLYIFEIIPRIFNHPEKEASQEIVAIAAKSFGVLDTAMARIQTAALQYVIRAAKKPIKKPVLLHAVLGETKVCSRVRITEPHAFCATIPGVRVTESSGNFIWPFEKPNENKVFFWQRLSPPNFQAQEELLRRGYLIVYEIDDDPQRWRESYERSDYLPFRSCHAVQVSTEALAAAVRQYNPHVMVFPNQVAELPPPRVYGEGPLELFFGALNREQDWPEIMPFLNDCLRETEHHVTVVHDRLFFDALATKNKEFVPLCPYEQYQQLLSQADIAVLPLTDTHFNRMKSDLKFLECAANGVVALASPVVYAQTIQDGSTGLIYRSPQEFGEKLARLLQDAPWRRELAGKAYEWVKENRLLCRHYEKRLAWYESLREQYDLLTEEIYQRMKRQRP